MTRGVNFVLVRTVFGAVLGMFYFGFNTGVVNAPEAAIKEFANTSYFQHYGSHLSDGQVNTLFTVITSAFIGIKHFGENSYSENHALFMFSLLSWRNDRSNGGRRSCRQGWKKKRIVVESVHGSYRW